MYLTWADAKGRYFPVERGDRQRVIEPAEWPQEKLTAASALILKLRTNERSAHQAYFNFLAFFCPHQAFQQQ